jgi:hypothetical protein
LAEIAKEDRIAGYKKEAQAKAKREAAELIESNK